MGPFYPTSKTDKLTYYSNRFNTVEINTTFYNIPPERTIHKWMKSAGNREFKFSIKFPGKVTHDLLVSNTPLALEKAAEFEKTHIIPFLAEGRLGSVLLQLPPSFGEDRMGKLELLLDRLDTGQISYFVEPRHKSLYGNLDFTRKVESRGAGIVELDGPMHEITTIQAGSRSMYVRFHGRNHESWNKRNVNASERYNYLYSDSEVVSFSEIIKNEEGKYEDIFIYFNNHPSGSATKNALTLASLLGLKSTDPQRKLM